jgi:hypothetical protein
MTKKLSVPEVLTILQSGAFDALKGTVEDGQIEFKGSPYQLSSDTSKCELAKDVSALANSEGGVIVLGVRTSQDQLSPVEYVDDCRPFDQVLFKADQYRKILDDWICPAAVSVEVSWFPSISPAGKGLAAIIVPAGLSENKPYLVARLIDNDGKVRGTQFGYYERVQDRVPATSVEIIRGYVRDGMRNLEIMQRLSNIETFLADSRSVVKPRLSDEELFTRISQAEEAVERSSQANLILAALPTTACAFPELFHSGSAAIVRLLTNPPVLRQDGFAATPRNIYQQQPEIVQGRLRRLAARGNRLIELWEDGTLIAVGPGDDDMLCWFMRNQKNPEPGLPIRNFVLAEVTLNFCHLAAEVFGNADPKPKALTFTLMLDNMTEDGVPCSLSSVPDDGPFGGGGHGRRDASSTTITSNFNIPLEGLDAGIVAYHLLGRLYAEFGFNYDDMPYIERDGDARRITPSSLFRKLT